MNADSTLADFFENHRKLLILTGAGISTDSGIPAYRDADGNWLHSKPVLYQDYIKDYKTRQRYWARSMLGWPRMQKNTPNSGHQALQKLESSGYLQYLITQNVDGMHQRAGSKNVIDLHGRIDTVICLSCRVSGSRRQWQALLSERNPEWQTKVIVASDRPDGDVIIDNANYSDFDVPDCQCGGIIKPEVVFFGESVPKATVEFCQRQLLQAPALLVIGSSLTVFSGFRFVKRAAELGKPVAILTRGKTRGDDLATLKLEQGCSQALQDVCSALNL